MRQTSWLLLFALWLAFLTPASADSVQTVTIATRDVPPFAMKDTQGQWHGLSIELWREIANELGLDFHIREMGLVEMLEAVERREVEAAVAGLTITREREQRMDFSHPFLSSGLGIAVRAKSHGGWLAVSQRFLSLGFLQIMLSLFGLLFVTGLLLWFVERRHNPQFGGSPVKGIGNGLWWSAVTMTTVGYGDKAPLTPAGRTLAIIWMFSGIIMVSSFTAAIATTLTLGELESKVQGREDLPRVRIASVSDTTSAAYLAREHLNFRTWPDLAGALKALSEGQVDAVVYDKPMLSYYSQQHPEQALRVLPGRFERQDYGIALTSGSPLREPLNQALLDRLHAPIWEELQHRYLGELD